MALVDGSNNLAQNFKFVNGQWVPVEGYSGDQAVAHTQDQGSFLNDAYGTGRIDSGGLDNLLTGDVDLNSWLNGQGFGQPAAQPPPQQPANSFEGVAAKPTTQTDPGVSGGTYLGGTVTGSDGIPMHEYQRPDGTRYRIPASEDRVNVTAPYTPPEQAAKPTTQPDQTTAAKPTGTRTFAPYQQTSEEYLALATGILAQLDKTTIDSMKPGSNGALAFAYSPERFLEIYRKRQAGGSITDMVAELNALYEESRSGQTADPNEGLGNDLDTTPDPWVATGSSETGSDGTNRVQYRNSETGATEWRDGVTGAVIQPTLGESGTVTVTDDGSALNVADDDVATVLTEAGLPLTAEEAGDFNVGDGPGFAEYISWVQTLTPEQLGFIGSIKSEFGVEFTSWLNPDEMGFLIENTEAAWPLIQSKLDAQRAIKAQADADAAAAVTVDDDDDAGSGEDLVNTVAGDDDDTAAAAAKIVGTVPSGDKALLNSLSTSLKNSIDSGNFGFDPSFEITDPDGTTRKVTLYEYLAEEGGDQINETLNKTIRDIEDRMNVNGLLRSGALVGSVGDKVNDASETYRVYLNELAKTTMVQASADKQAVINAAVQLIELGQNDRFKAAELTGMLDTGEDLSPERATLLFGADFDPEANGLALNTITGNYRVVEPTLAGAKTKSALFSEDIDRKLKVAETSGFIPTGFDAEGNPTYGADAAITFDREKGKFFDVNGKETSPEASTALTADTKKWLTDLRDQAQQDKFTRDKIDVDERLATTQEERVSLLEDAAQKQNTTDTIMGLLALVPGLSDVPGVREWIESQSGKGSGGGDGGDGGHGGGAPEKEWGSWFDIDTENIPKTTIQLYVFTKAKEKIDKWRDDAANALLDQTAENLKGLMGPAVARVEDMDPALAEASRADVANNDGVEYGYRVRNGKEYLFTGDKQVELSKDSAQRRNNGSPAAWAEYIDALREIGEDNVADYYDARINAPSIGQQLAKFEKQPDQVLLDRHLTARQQTDKNNTALVQATAWADLAAITQIAEDRGWPQAAEMKTRLKGFVEGDDY